MNSFVCIMICTRRRPRMLGECLKSVLPQLNGGEGGDCVVVIENDDHPRSRDVVDRFKALFPDLNIVYALEPELGISPARNRGLAIAKNMHPEWLGFLDDDEVVTEGWLPAMRRAMVEFKADVLTSGVRYITPATLPLFYRRPSEISQKRGTLLNAAATNNTFLRKSWLTEQEEEFLFDSAFRFLGGSDIEFFSRLTSLGGRIVWVDDAFVEEEVPDGRISLSYNMRRWQRVAAVMAYLRIRQNGRWKAFWGVFPRMVEWCALGTLLIVYGGVEMAFSRDQGAARIMSGLKKLSSFVGLIRGFFYLLPQPYKNVDGS
ncbi:glycosyltransferase family 2 protein [uncultured Martelella sp.]|uniref:glycosyltransferase family 2 protein n=1 Tax=uncultured Martelella sp. TaxID=392331 RepID=UPI0029C60101|nr:glycosyltransferase family 2 protein [uncultured Martelella sp.]